MAYSKPRKFKVSFELEEVVSTPMYVVPLKMVYRHLLDGFKYEEYTITKVEVNEIPCDTNK